MAANGGKKPVFVMFGGISAEHEVSVITGLQVVEKIDRDHYLPHVILVSKRGEFFYLSNLESRTQFLSAPRREVTFGADENGGFMCTPGLFGKKIYPYAAYLAFHGGIGEGGGIQGMLESLRIPFTSAGQESSVICINKQIMKDLVEKTGVIVVPGVSIFAKDVRGDVDATARKMMDTLSLPVIIKPAHLGSSIGISIARTEIELQKHLLEAVHMDSEILVEKLLADFVEYNCSVRNLGEEVQTSVIERPIKRDEVLSFADKYERGGKRQSGMASLDREIPAKIDSRLKARIEDAARKVYGACRAKGVVRIDFMYTKHDDILYITEPNSIPGSMAFYLWEAAGISFKQQITDSLEQAVLDAKESSDLNLEYKSDIVEKFVRSL